MKRQDTTRQHNIVQDKTRQDARRKVKTIRHNIIQHKTIQCNIRQDQAAL